MKLKAYITQITFQNPDNGYTVAQCTPLGEKPEESPEEGQEKDRIFSPEEEEELTLVGEMPGLTQGLSIEAEGAYTEHPVYGRQFKVSAFKEVRPEGALAIERYLAGRPIKGIGPRLAKKIVGRFGDDTFRIIDTEPERLAEIKGISLRMAREIGEENAEKRELREALIFLGGFGIRGETAQKLFKVYGEGIFAVLRENPYDLIRKVEGIGFKKADEIAAKAGIRADSEFRIRGGLTYALQRLPELGHTWMPREELVKETAELLGLSPEQVEEEIVNLIMDRCLILKGEKAYLPRAYYAELSCARMLADLAAAFSGVGARGNRGVEEEKGEGFTEGLGEWEGEAAPGPEAAGGDSAVRLDAAQQRAVELALNSGVFLMTGGPGTGKTTTIKAILSRCEAEGREFLLAAPTGRAAKRITEATGCEAFTIHRLLELIPGPRQSERSFVYQRNEDNPLEADVIIIDEMSMVDIFLFQALLKATPPGTRLILSGDADQLPSVGAGQVLKDLLDFGGFPTVRLKEIHRQELGSDIVKNAHMINRGELPVLDNQSRDFFFLPRDRAEVIQSHMIYFIGNKLPAYVGVSPLELQVMTPMKKGPLGAENLNRLLQQSLNPPGDNREELETERWCFRTGDKVMQVKNNYQLEWQIPGRRGIVIDSGTGVFNGDMGRILSINRHSREVTVEFDEGRQVVYSPTSLSELEPAYCITIHKAQGSEYPAVIIPLLSGPSMLMTRKLLYTAVTRAKACVVILGSRQQLEAMIRNTGEQVRNTGLRERLEEIFGMDEEIGNE